MKEEHHGVVFQQEPLVHLVVVQVLLQFNRLEKRTVRQREDKKCQPLHPGRREIKCGGQWSLNLSPAQHHSFILHLVTVGSFSTKGLHSLTSRTVLREVIGSHEPEVILEVVYSDHAPQ